MSTNPMICGCSGFATAASYKLVLSPTNVHCMQCSQLAGTYFLAFDGSGGACAWGTSFPPGACGVSFIGGTITSGAFGIQIGNDATYITTQKDLVSGPFSLALNSGGSGACDYDGVTLMPVGPAISSFTFVGTGCPGCLARGCSCHSYSPPYLGPPLRCCRKICTTNVGLHGPGCHCCCNEVEEPPYYGITNDCVPKRQCQFGAYELKCDPDTGVNPKCKGDGGGCGGSCGCGGTCGCSGCSGGAPPANSGQGQSLLESGMVGKLACAGSTVNFANGNLVLSLDQPRGAPFGPLPNLTYNSIWPTASEFGYGWSGLFNQRVSQITGTGGYIANITKGDGGSDDILLRPPIPAREHPKSARLLEHDGLRSALAGQGDDRPTRQPQYNAV